jgi:hypothetical protein
MCTCIYKYLHTCIHAYIAIHKFTNTHSLGKKHEILMWFINEQPPAIFEARDAQRMAGHALTHRKASTTTFFLCDSRRRCAQSSGRVELASLCMRAYMACLCLCAWKWCVSVLPRCARVCIFAFVLECILG